MITVEAVLFAFLCAGVFLLYWGYYVEPQKLEIVEVAIKTEKPLATPLKIVQISDVHLGPFYSLDKFRSIIDKINHLKADFIVITGDLIDNATRYQDFDKTAQLLAKLTAKYDRLSILGNHEAKYRVVDKVIKMYQQAGITLLVNHGHCYQTEDIHIHIYGADCAIYGERINDFVADKTSQAFSMLLLHQPDAVVDYFDKSLDLVLSGHTHNGQVNLWGVVSIRPKLGKKYLCGMYHHKGKYGSIQHYVNRGLGMTHFPFRLNNAPEITVFNISS